MTVVSFSGLDLSFLKDPKNRLPPQPAKRRAGRKAPSKRSSLACPSLVPDINSIYAGGGYKSPIDNTFISSRSQLVEHDRKHGVVQCGEMKGKIGMDAQAKRFGWDQPKPDVEVTWKSPTVTP